MSSCFPINFQKNPNSNLRYIILKGKNKIKEDKWPRLTIASHYIGNRANKFGVFTNQYSINRIKQLNIDPNFFSKFTNKKLNSLINFNPEDLDKFKEIPIKDARKTSINKFLQTIWYNGIPTPLNVLIKQRSKFMNYIKDRKTQTSHSVLFHKTNSNKNYSKTINSMIISDSEISNGLIIGDNDKSYENSYNSGSYRMKMFTPVKNKMNNSSVQLREKIIPSKHKNLSQQNLMRFDISLFPKPQGSDKRTLIKRIKLNHDKRKVFKEDYNF